MIDQQKALFNYNIAPACEYCAKSRAASGGTALLCDVTDAAVAAYHQCALFYYDPLRRVPKRAPKMPTFTPEDFKL